MDVSRVEYLHFPVQGIVVAKIEGCAWDAVDEINNKFIQPSTSALFIDWKMGRKHAEFKMPHSFKAIARCHEEDEYDEKKGESIALKKLTDKYQSSLNKRFYLFLKYMDKSLKIMDKYFEGKTFQVLTNKKKYGIIHTVSRQYKIIENASRVNQFVKNNMVLVAPQAKFSFFIFDGF